MAGSGGVSRASAAARRAAAARAAASAGAFTSVAFLVLGTGVALPWTLLRAGVVYFVSSVPQGDAIFLQLYMSYYLPALPSLLLQSRFDRAVDARFGAAVTFPVRLLLSLSVLALALGAMALMRATSAGVLTVGLAVGVFDSIAYGSASQLFSVFPRASGAAYFTGASVSSLLAVALGYATGFSGDAPSAAQAEAVYLGGAVAVLLALAVTAALLRSEVGQRHLALISVAAPAPAHGADAGAAAMAEAGPEAEAAKSLLINDALLEGGSGGSGSGGGGSGGGRRNSEDEDDELEPPQTPRMPSAFAGSTMPSAWRRASLAEQQGAAGDAKQLPLSLNGGPLSGGQNGGPSGGRDAAGGGRNVDLLRATWVVHASLFFLWASTVLVDSLISFVPSESERSGGGPGGGSGLGGPDFRLYVLYGSLAGELLGKQVNLAWTMLARPDPEPARSRDVEMVALESARANGAAGASGGAPPEGEGDEDDEDEDEDVILLKLPKRAAGEAGGAGAPPAPRALALAWLRARLPARPALALLLLLTALRTLGVAPMLYYIVQPYAGAAAALPPVSCDACYLGAQALFDFSGALLSCFAYAIAPQLLRDRAHAPQSSSLLALSLTAGTYAGLAAAFALQRTLLSSAPVTAAR